MFLIMIITMILPPVAIITISSVYDPPYQDRFKKDLDTHLQSQLDNGEITKDEYKMIKEKISKKETKSLIQTSSACNICNICCVVSYRNKTMDCSFKMGQKIQAIQNKTGRN